MLIFADGSRHCMNPWKECNLSMMAERDVLLARRTSGGGAVYHDMGNTNYTVVMPRDAFTRDRCAEMVARALVNEDIPAYVNARHDVAVDGKKISGSAFKLTSKRAFHHGTMLIDADLRRLDGCLRSKAHGEITALGVDSVRSTVANLREYSWAIDHQGFCDAVMLEFSRSFGALDHQNVTVWNEDDIAELVDDERQRIRTWKWLYGQTPRFVHSFDTAFSWGTVFARITMYHGLVAEVSLSDSPDVDADTDAAASAATLLPHVRECFDAVARVMADAPYEAIEIRRRLEPVHRSGPHAGDLCEWLVAKVSDAASGKHMPSGDLV
ncbi:hypothetical protein J3B02_001554 [Coemansia erecta]|nr:hypothetical protein J3B02_001554 [Coemansia erecta]